MSSRILYEKLMYFLPEMTRYARAITKSPEDAEDLVQDVCCTLVRKQPVCETYNCRRWFLKILSNHYKNSVQRRRFITTALVWDTRAGKSSSTMQTETREIPDKRYTPDSALVRQEVRADIRIALRKLPVCYRRDIIRHVMYGDTYPSMHKKNGTSIGTMRSRVKRGKKLLREHLKEYGTTNFDD